VAEVLVKRILKVSRAASSAETGLASCCLAMS